MSCDDTLKVIKGCCGEPAIKAQVGIGYIYVPNVFTPNHDQINDRFVIYGENMKRVVSLRIRHQNGVLVYTGMDQAIPNHLMSWDGSFHGVVERGVYSYELEVESVDGTRKSFKGQVCSFPCDQETDQDVIPLQGCEFGPPDTNFDPPYIPWEQLPCF